MCRAFEFRAFCDLDLRVACDLDESVMTITAPPLSVIYSEYRWMAFSVNLEERRAFERMLANAEIGSEERVIHLTSQEVSMLEQLLSDEGLKFLDGLDDPKYEAASLG